MANFLALGMRPIPLHPHAVRLCRRLSKHFINLLTPQANVPPGARGSPYYTTADSRSVENISDYRLRSDVQPAQNN